MSPRLRRARRASLGKSAARKKPAITLKPGEIVVGRRLYRSGQSEYLINGRVARLRDVQELFMGMGLGPGQLRDHRAGAHWADSEFEADGPAGDH